MTASAKKHSWLSSLIFQPGLKNPCNSPQPIILVGFTLRALDSLKRSLGTVSTTVTKGWKESALINRFLRNFLSELKDEQLSY